jgi:CheY-like chemotaxis protein
MAAERVLIEEPNLDVRDLIVHLVSALGCEPLVLEARDEVDLDDVDLIVAEPASSGAERLFDAHKRRRSRVPVVCASIYPRDYRALPPHVAYLMKPFVGADLQAAIRAALA